MLLKTITQIIILSFKGMDVIFMSNSLRYTDVQYEMLISFINETDSECTPNFYDCNKCALKSDKKEKHQVLSALADKLKRKKSTDYTDIQQIFELETLEIDDINSLDNSKSKKPFKIPFIFK